MNSEELKSVVESLLFAAGAPLSLRKMVEIFEGEVGKAEVRSALAALQEEYSSGRRGFRLLEVAGGYQFRTVAENAAYVRRLFRERPGRLSRAALETLAIIAYKQPVTKAEIEAIRGVEVDGVLGSLLARQLIRVLGRKEVPGRPWVYGTTPQFLELFGLRDLSDLPPLREVEASLSEKNESEDKGAPSQDFEPGGHHLTPQGGKTH